MSDAQGPKIIVDSDWKSQAQAEKELELATMLVETLAASFEPEKYQDSYRENLLALVKAKAEGRQLVEAPPVEASKVVDILEALKQSLSAARKPPAVASEARPTAAAAPAAPPRARRRRVAGG